MEPTQRQADLWLDPDDIDPLANHPKRRSSRARYRDSAMIRLLADIGLKPGEIAGGDPEVVVQIGDVSLSDPDGGDRLSNPSLPMGGCVMLRPEVATTGPSKDIVVTFQDPKTAMVLYRHLTKLENPATDDPLFSSAKGGPLSKRHVSEIVSNAAETAQVRPETPDGRGSPRDVNSLTLRNTAAYRRLRFGESLDTVADRQRLSDARSADYYFAELVAAVADE